MKNGMVIIDADGHAVDSEAAYREWLPEKYRKRQTIYPGDGFDRRQGGKLDKTPKSPTQNLADNDKEGIDLQIIYPTGGLALSKVREADYAIALAETYNNWLADWCSADKKRLKGVALVPLHADVKASIAEMERAMSKLGTVGVMVNTYDRSRNVAHKDFWPFYAECARQGV
ncbi:MAG: amidohydrolase family protein, partial [Proteobacteria bacterium]|nr:amidohydrolase family protein [Pseudomonadota bacterium]